jgi:hypothetical protein
MASNDLDSVSGYWLGPHLFGSPSSELLASSRMPWQGPTARRHPLRCGGEAVVSETGVVLLDFSGLEPGDPTAKDLAAAPFSDWPRKAAASVVAPRRVELLNAHQLCLLDAISQLYSGGEGWSPDPRPVSVLTLWTGPSTERIVPPNAELPDYLSFLRARLTVLRDVITIPTRAIERSFATFEQILEVTVAPRACHCLLHAADHYRHWRFDQALTLAWAAVEALLAHMWARHVEDTAVATGHVLSNKRRHKLTGREFTSSVVSESLALAGLIDQDLYDMIARARAARNRWIHGLDPVTEPPAASAFFAGQKLLDLLAGCRLRVAIGLSGPSV